MERTRGTWMAIIFCGQITIILLLQTVMQVSSVFLRLKCTGGTDGATPDAPCMLKAYLGSEVTLECAKHSYTKLEPDYLTAASGHVCKEKLKADPATCPDNGKLKYATVGLGDILIDSETLTIPFHRNKKLMAPTKVYGRCAKDASEALYWGIEFIPRPKFPDEGRIISCFNPVTTAGRVCNMNAHLSDTIVFECPVKGPKLVPPQANDRPHVCQVSLNADDATCPGSKDIGGDGVTLTYLKHGAAVSSAAFRCPVSKTGQADKIEGALNCEGTDSTRFYRASVDFKAGSHTMPKNYKLCDPFHGAKQGAPCTATLKVGESIVINCGMLPETSPGNILATDGSYCMRPVGVDKSDVCADASGKWRDVGAELFMNASNIVITHKKKDLAKAITVYGKCFDGADANYFKIKFSEAGASDDDDKPKDSYAAGASTKIAVFFGVLGTAFLATETAYKVF